MEWFRIIREAAWHNAGFDSLRKIQVYLKDYEPHYEPTIIPLPLSESEAKARGRKDQLSALLRENDRPHDLGLYSVADFRALYLSGELTPTDVVKAILPLIRPNGIQPGKHSIAWTEIKLDQILKAAEASTQRYNNKQSLGPLDGIPSGIKDDYDLDGYATTLGSATDHAGVVSDETSSTSWLARKLEDAGVIILGKLHMHEFGLGMSTF